MPFLPALANHYRVEALLFVVLGLVVSLEVRVVREAGRVVRVWTDYGNKLSRLLAREELGPRRGGP